jgi:hypothetical protein
MNKYYQLAGFDVNGGQILWREQYYPEYAEMLFLVSNEEPCGRDSGVSII